MAQDYKYILGVDPGETTGFMAVDARGLYVPVAGVDSIAFPRKTGAAAEKSQAQLLSELYDETIERIRRLLGYAQGAPVLVVMDAPVHSRFANYFAYELRGVVKLATANQGLGWYLVPPSTIQKTVLGRVVKDSGGRKKLLREAVVNGLCIPKELAADANEHDIDAGAVALTYCQLEIKD